MGKDAPFTIGTLRLKLHVPASGSLKDKRQVIRSLKDTLHNKFNVSVAEIGEQDKWQLAELGVAVCRGDQAHLSEVLNHLLNLVRGFPMAMLTVYEMEFFAAG